MTSLTFDSALVGDLLDGSKTATVRYDLDEDLSPGDRIELHTQEGPFGTAYVEDVVRTELGDALAVVEDRGYQHNAASVADLWTALDGYYPSADLGLSSTVAVVLLDDAERREFVELERNSLDDVGVKATQVLSEEAKHAAASFVVRAGLGPTFVRLAQSGNHYDPTPEELGAFLSISFDPEEDPLQDAVWDGLYREATGDVLLDPTDARQLADHLADADIDRRDAHEQDPGPSVLFEWAKELRHRANERTRR